MHCYDSMGNIKEITIQEIIKGPALSEIKSHMARGEWHPSCGECKKLEEETGVSPRTVRTMSPDTLHAIDQDPEWFAPEHLVINWSNLCNLTCTYCNAETSTAWQAIKGIPINYVKNEHSDLIQLVKEQGHLVQGLTLGGGEPLLQKGLPEFLKYLNPAKIKVLVTTNLSVDLKNNPVYRELKDWPYVDWQISFDNATQQQFEYVRAGANWNQFVENIKILNYDQQKVLAHPAYSIYCAYDLVSYYDFCVEHNLNMFWCYLSHPFDLDVRRLSEPMRKLAQKEIEKVVKKYGQHQNLAIDTLQRYHVQLETEATPVIDMSLGWSTYRADPIKYANQIERELKLTSTFEQLWPHVVEQLNKHYY